MTYRFHVLNLAGLALLGAAYRQGWVQLVLDGDRTHLSVVIFGVFVGGVIAAALSYRKFARYIQHSLVMLGLIGTVIGFIIALQGVDPSSVGDIDSVAVTVAHLISGLGVAMFTTLVGSIGALWMSALLYVSDG